ncbi:glycosyltransferase family 2 protein [Amphritea balenae]|uniref:Glycosyltransferase family 2 protein n=1 Tax=Amphritea balenae TaxID=452629 RepID=A0A3P1SRB3_9GAMM|nr:glycosyltransferase family 2 protein [Amphritea balenae]GGK73246.1 hypothetical protein GCM10007941_24100 [Amphritea balenae]
MAMYNGERFLEEQLESINDQTFRPYELIIIDDCSKDASVNIVKRYSEEVSFPVRLHLNSKNIGSTLTFCKAISLSEGDVVVLCDQDDLWVEDRLEKIKSAFEEDYSRVGVYSNASLIDQDGNYLGRNLWSSLSIKNDEFKALATGGYSAFSVLLARNVITGAAFAFKKRYVQSCQKFPESWVHDAWIAINVVRSGPIHCIPECLVKYRQHDGNQIGLNQISTFGRLIARLKFRSEDYFIGLISDRKILLDYLVNSGEDEVFSNLVGDAVTHFKSRVEGKRNRFIFVRELIYGRYHKFSSGFSSFVKDFLGF